MGGFMLFDGDQAPRTLLPEELKSYLERGEIDISEKEIQDKSKGDILSKGVVIVQTGWFVLQCISRGVQHLPVSELEIVTLAFAILNIITYGLWWNKPLNVECPFRVFKWPEQRHGGQERDDVCSGFKYAVITVIRKASGGIRHTVNASWTEISTLPLRSFLRMGSDPYDDEIESRVNRVPTLYAGKITPGRWIFIIGIVAAVASMFGAIHCIAWSFQFPSHWEQILWCTSSLTITCLPVGFLTCAAVVNLLPASVQDELLPLLTFSFCFLYILARIDLLVQALIALRSLPPGAYQAVQWTSFIPHPLINTIESQLLIVTYHFPNIIC